MGETPDAIRADIFAALHSGEVQILVATTALVGEGFAVTTYQGFLQSLLLGFRHVHLFFVHRLHQNIDLVRKRCRARDALNQPSSLKADPERLCSVPSCSDARDNPERCADLNRRVCTVLVEARRMVWLPPRTPGIW